MKVAGLDSGRLVRKWVSAAEGRRWADTIIDLVRKLPSVKPEDIDKAAAWAKDARVKYEKRVAKHREKSKAAPAMAGAAGGAA
jgi:hypothetical protein